MAEAMNRSEVERLQSLPIFKSPLCLISSDINGVLTIEESVVTQLESVDLPVNVVAIAGLYRTGKSYLMNRLAHVNTGFALGNTTESKTKGIWMWCKIHPTQKNQVLVLLDTEGLGDVLKGDIHHDNKIFTLAALLSSTLVYNMMGAFNQDAVEKLTFITEMSSSMKLGKTVTSDTCFDLVLPRFVLCLRDFFLDPRDEGRPITPDEYLEVCLRERKGDTPQDEKYNRPRACIKKYFIHRKVFTFERPGTSRKIMSRLEEARDDELSEDFLEDTVKFTSYIFNCEPKQIIGTKQPVTGSMLANLARAYVNAMKDGAVPCIDDAMTTMTKLENEKAVKKAVETFSSCIKSVELPVFSRAILLQRKFDIQKQVFKELTKKLVFDDEDEAGRKAEAKMEEIFAETEMENNKLVEEKCMQKLDDLYQNLRSNNSNGKYNVPGGYIQYKEEFNNIIKKFEDDMRDVDQNKRLAVLNEFEMKVKKETEEIMARDMQMSEEARKNEMESRQAELQHQYEESMTSMKKQLEEQTKKQHEEIQKIKEEKERTERESMKAFKEELLASHAKEDSNFKLTEYLELLRLENLRMKEEKDQGVLTKMFNFLFKS